MALALVALLSGSLAVAPHAQGSATALDPLDFDPRELPVAESGRWSEDRRATVDERAASLAAGGDQAYRAGDFPRAIGFLRGCLEAEPDFPPALQLLGTALFRLQRYGDAAECLERFAKHMPQDIWRTQALGHCYYSLGDYSKALAHYDVVFAAQPEDIPPSSLAEARRGRGLALYRLGEMEKALVELREVTRLRPDHAEAWQWIGQLEYEEDRLDEALEALDRAVAVARHDPRVWFLLAKVYTALERDDDAIAARRRFEDLDRITQEIRAVRARLRLNPSDYVEALRLVELCKTTGDVQGVRDALEIAVLARSGSTREIEVRLFALKTLLRVGDKEAAAEAARALEECCSDDPEAWKELAVYFGKVGDTRRQIEAGEKYRRLRSSR